MKTLIVILIIAAFLQSSILSMNLVLIIFICRSFQRISKSNLYLAFGFGLLISHLNLTTLGFDSLIFIICVQLTQVFSKARFTRNSLLIVPISLVLLIFSQVIASVFLHQSLNLFPKVLFETLISLPLFYALRLWEERFIARGDIKLKV